MNLSSIDVLNIVCHADRCLYFKDDFIKEASELFAEYGVVSPTHTALLLWKTYEKYKSISLVYQEYIHDDITRNVIGKMVDRYLKMYIKG